MTAQSVTAKLKLAARPPRIPVPKLAATHTPSMRRPLAPIGAGRLSTGVTRALRLPIEQPPLQKTYARFEAPAEGQTANPMPRYMFRPNLPTAAPQPDPFGIRK